MTFRESQIICDVCKKSFIGLIGFHKTCLNCVQKRTNESIIIKKEHRTVQEILAKPISPIIELKPYWNDKLVEIYNRR